LVEGSKALFETGLLAREICMSHRIEFARGFRNACRIGTDDVESRDRNGLSGTGSSMNKQISFTLPPIKVRKGPGKPTQVQRDRTKYTRKEKHRVAH
jgi:hypothetical protein